MLRSSASNREAESLGNRFKPHNFQSNSAISKIKLLASGSASVCALLLSIAPAHAQTIVNTPGQNALATATYDSSAVTFTPSAAEDLVTVSAPEAVINWTTNASGAVGTEVNFLPAVNSLRFTSDNSDYTVLNRILTPGAFNSPIRIDGSVRSEFTGTGDVAGNIWFYSPGGIIAGAGSVFDVGSLVLTTNDIDTSGGLFGLGGQIRFRGTAGSTSALQIENGAQIFALNDGSYVALVAPRIEQGGAVDVNGSAAYVATEQANLTLNNGLFDISIPIGSGTTDANGILHTGTTTGDASTSQSTDAQAIYMAALPKTTSDVVSMLVGGNVGYRPAVSAGIENGKIVLSNSYNVSVGASGADPVPVISTTPTNGSTGSANIFFDQGNFISDVALRTRGLTGVGFDGATPLSGALNFDGDLSLDSGFRALFAFTGTGQMTVGGDLGITAASNIFVNHDFSRPAGHASLDIGGNLTATALGVTLNNSRISGDQVALQATVGGVFGTGEIVSAGDVGITVATSIQASLIDASAGQLTSFAGVGGGSENLFTVPGFISVGNYITGDTTRFRVEAGGNAIFESIETPGTAIELAAAQGGTGIARLGTATDATRIVLEGEGIQFNNLNAATGNIRLLATNGDVLGGSATAITTLDIDATVGAITAFNLSTVNNGITLDAANDIAINTANGTGSFSANSTGGDFSFFNIFGPSANITAANITGNAIETTTNGSTNTITLNTAGNIGLSQARATEGINFTAGGTLTADFINSDLLTTISAGTIDVTQLNSGFIANITSTVGDIDIGRLTGGASFNLISNNANIVLGDTSAPNGVGFRADNGTITYDRIFGGSVTLNAGGNITGNGITATGTSVGINSGGILTTGNISANDNIQIDVATANLGDVTNTGTAFRIITIDADDITTQNINSTGIVTFTAANGNLFTGDIETGLSTSPGSTSLSTTNGNITTGDISTGNIGAAADGNITVGIATANGGGASDIRLDAGGTLNFDSVQANRIVNLDGTVITGGNVTATTAGSDINGTDITLGDVTADDNLSIDATAGSITTGALFSGLSTVVTASDNFNIASAENGNTTTLRLTATGGSGTVGDVTSLDAISIVTGTDLNTGILDAATSVTVVSGGTPTIADAIAGSSARITGATITLDSATTGTDLALRATAGDLDATGTFNIGTNIDLDATGDIVFGTLTAASIFDVDAGGDVTFNTANINNNTITINADGNIVGVSANNLAAAGDGGQDGIRLEAVGEVTLTGVSRAENNITLLGTNIDVGTLSAAVDGAGSIIATGTGTVAVDNILAAGPGVVSRLTGTSIDVADATVDGSLIFISTVGNINITGAVSAGQDANLDAAGDIALGTFITGDELNATTISGNISFTAANSTDGSVDLDAGGNITGTNVNSLSPAGSPGADDVRLIAGGDILVTGDIRAENILNLDGNNITTGGLTTGEGGSGILLVNGSGAVTLASATTLGASVAADFTGTSIEINGGNLAGSLTAEATAGDLDIVDVTNSGTGSVDLRATGAVAFGSLTAPSFFNVDAGVGASITFNTASIGAGNITMDAGADINGVSVIHLSNVGTGGDDSVVLTAIGDISLTGESRAENNIVLTAVNVDAASLVSGNGGSGATTIIASGTAVIGNLDTNFGGNDANITATDITINGGNILGDVVLRATAGNIDASGISSSFGNVDLDAIGNITFGNLSGSSLFDVDAGGSISFGTASLNNGSITMDAGGSITGVSAMQLSVSSGGLDDVRLTAVGDISLSGTSRAENNIVLDGANVTAGTLNASAAGSGGFNITATGIVDIDAANASGGSSSITATTVDVDDMTLVGGLTLAATGDVTLGTISASNRVDIDTSTGNVLFDTITTTGDSVFIDATIGNITGVTASNLSVSTGGIDDVRLAAGGDVLLTGGSRAENTITLIGTNVTAGQLVGADSGGGGIVVTATGAVDIDTANTISVGGNASITGSTVDIDNMAIRSALTIDATDTITLGTVAANDLIDIDTDTNIIFDTITTTNSSVLINATGNITGVTASNLSVSTSGTDDVRLEAGGDITITGGSRAENTVTLIGTNITAGTLEGAAAGGGGLVITATGAADIDTANTTSVGGNAIITGGSIAIDNMAIRSDLTIDTTGDVTLGTVETNSVIDIDTDTNISFDTITTTNGSVLIDAIGNITGITASNLSSATSGADDVRLEAGGNIFLTGGSRAETNVTLIGTDITAGTLTANGGGTLTVSGAGAVSVDNAIHTSSGAPVVITGGSVTLNNSNILGSLTVNATTGDINGNGLILARDLIDFDAARDVNFGTINGNNATFNIDAGRDVNFVAATSNTNINLTATGGINGGNLTAAGNLNLNGGNIGIGSASANAINFTSALDILFDTITSPNAISMTALNGAIGKTLIGAGDVSSSAGITLNAAATDVGTLDATTSIAVTASGRAIVDATISGTSTSITGGLVTLNSGTIGADLTLNVTAGNLDGSGNISVNGLIDLDATGNITFGALTAGTTLRADAGGNINFTQANTLDGNVELTAVGNIVGGSLTTADAITNTVGPDDIRLDAGGNINITGNIFAQDAALLDADNIAITSAEANRIDFTSTQNILFDTITSSDLVILSATAGTVGKTATGAGDITADGRIIINALSTDLGTIDAQNVGSTSLNLIASGAANIETLNASDDVSIQGASVTLNNATVAEILSVNTSAGNISSNGTIAGRQILLDAVGDIQLNDASGAVAFRADSTGVISFNTVDATAGNLIFDAGTDIIGVSANNNSLDIGGANNVELTAGGNITLTGVSQARDSIELTGVNINAGTLSGGLDGAGQVNVTATGVVVVDTINSNDPTFAANSITGTSVTLNNGNVAGSLTLNATVGNIGSSGIIAVGGAANFDATGSIALSTANAGTGFDIDADGNVSFTQLQTSDNALTIDADGDIVGGSASNLTVPISGGLDDVRLTAGGDITLTGTSRAENSIVLTATNINAATLSAGEGNFGTITVNATNNAVVDTANTLGANVDAFLTGGTVTLNNGSFAGDLTLNVTAGDIDGSGGITVAGAIDLDATGDVGFGSLTAGGGAFDVNAGGDISFASANSTNAIDMTAVGAINGGDLDATNALNLNGDNIAIGNATASGINFTSATDILFDSITSPNTVALTALAGTIGKTATGAGEITSGAAVTLNSAIINIGDIDAQTNVDIDATGSIDAGNILTNDGTVIIDADTTLTAGDIQIATGGLISSELMTLNAGGDMVLGDVSAIDALTITGGGSLTADALNGNVLTVTATGAADIGTVTSNSTIDVTATSIEIDQGGTDMSIVNGDINLTATTGNVTLGTLNTELNFNVDAPGDIAFGTLTGKGIFLDAGGMISGTSASADRIVNSSTPRNVELTAGTSVNVTSLSATNDVVVDAANFLANTIETGQGVAGVSSDLNVNVTGDVDLGTLTVGGAVDITAANITLGDTTSLTSSTLTATNSAGIVALADFDSEVNLTINAPGNVTFNNLFGRGVFVTSGGNITGTSANTDRAVNSGTPRDVQLTATGAVNVSSFSAINDVEITAASFTTDTIVTGAAIGGVASDVFIDVTGIASIVQANVQGTMTVDAASIDLGTALMLGTTTLTSLTGDVDVTSITSDQNIVIDSAQAANIGSLLKRGGDTLGNESFNVTAATDIVVSGTLDTHDAINLTATRSVDAQQLIAFDSVNVTAGTTASIAGITTTANGAANLSAQSITSGNIIALGGTTANATAGNLLLTDVTGNGPIDLDATGTITFGTLTSGGLINVNGVGGVAGGSALKSGTDSLGNESFSFISLGNVSLTGTIDTHDSIVVNAGGTATANLLQAFDNVTVTSTGLTDIANIVTTNTGNVTINSGSVTLADAAVDGNFSATSIIGDINITGSLDPTTGLTVDSAANIIFDTIDISNGNLSLTAVSNVIGVNAINSAVVGSSGQDRTIIDAGGNIILTGVAQSVDDSVLLNATGNINVANIDVQDNVEAIGGGTTTIGAVTQRLAGLTGTFRGSSVTLNSGSISGDLIVDATAGNIDGSGAISVAGAIDFDATGDVGFGSLTAAGGAFDIDAGGDINFIGATSTNNINMTAAGAINGGDLNATNALNLNGGDVAIGNAMASSINFSSAADILFDTITSPNAVALTALSGTIGKTLTGAGDITSGAGITLNASNTNVGTLDATGVLSVTASEAAVIDSAIATSNSAIIGNSITLNNSDMDLSLTLNAGAGGILSRGTLQASSLNLRSIGGDIDLATTNTVSGTTVNADGAVDLGTTTASNLVITAGTDLTTNSLTATSGFGDSIQLTAGSALTLRSAQAPGVIRLNGDTINASNIDTSLLAANATGAIVLDNITATSNSIIAGASVALNDVTNDLSYTVTSTAGNISSTGILTASNLTFDATGDIALGDATATSAINLAATGAIGFGMLTGSNLTLNAGTNLTGDLLTATSGFGDSMRLTAGNLIEVTEIDAPGVVRLNAASADIDTFSAALLTTNITSQLALDSTTLTSNSTITAGSITLGDLTNNLFTTLNATTGDVVATGTLTGSGFSVAAANIQLTAVEATGSANTFTATGLATVDTINSASSVAITGASVALNNGNIGTGIGGGNLTLNATSGDVNGTGTITVSRVIDLDATDDVNFGSLANNSLPFNVDAGGDINFAVASSNNDIALTALGNINGGDLNAGDTITLNSGNIAIGEAVAGNVDFTSTLDILFDTITSPNAISLTALSGTIGKTITGAGDIASGAGITLNSATTDLGTLDTTTSIAVTTSGNAIVENAISGTTTNISGGNITLDSGTIGTDLILNVTAGDLDGSGALTVGGAIDFDATGDVGFGTLTAGNGVFDINAGNDINFVSAISTSDINMVAMGSINGGDLDAANALNLNGNAIAIGDAQADSLNLTSATNLLFDSITSPNAVTLTAANGLIGKNTGSGDISSGGDVSISSQAVDVGTLDSGGNIDATITLNDASFGLLDATGSITVNASAGLAVDRAVSGTATTLNAAEMVTVGDGNVGTNLSINTDDDILLAFDGNEQLIVGGAAIIESNDGSISITHTNNGLGINSINTTGNFIANAFLDFNSTAGSQIAASGTANVRAERNASVADISGVGTVDIYAMQNVIVNNAAVTGTPTTFTGGAGTSVTGPQLLIQAGLDPSGTPAPTPTASYDPNFDATVTGNVASTGFITVNSGGNAVFATGSNTVSDNGLTVQTGDDIIIASGASLVAGANPATTANTTTPFSTPNNLVLQAGNLTPLSTVPASPIASIVAAGNIDSNDFAVIMSANAIDGLGGAISAGSIAADINGAPPASFAQSDDNGLLSASCVQGNLCLGTLSADNIISIGQSGEPIQVIIETANVAANRILVSSRNDIVMGVNGTPSNFVAGNEVFVNSTSGDVDLRNAALSSDIIRIDAAGSLLGSGSLSSVNDIGITVGADINAALIDTGGQLTTVAGLGGLAEAIYSVPGSINVSTLTQGRATDLDINAGGNISFGQINLPNRNLALTAANGDVFLGTNTGTSAIDINAQNVLFNNLTGFSASLTASTGSIVGIGPGTMGITGSIVLDAVNGGITTGNLDGRDLIINAGGNILLGDANTLAFIDIDTTGGDVTFDNANTDQFSIEIDAAGDITGISVHKPLVAGLPVPQSIALNAGGNLVLTGNSRSFADIFLTAGGNLDVNTLESIQGTIRAIATGTAEVDNIINGETIFETRIEGSSVTLGDADVGRLILGASNGNTNITSNVAARRNADFSATQDIAFGSITAGEGLYIDAGGNVTFTEANTDDFDVDIDAGGNITGQSISVTALFGQSGRGNAVLTAGGDIAIAGAINALEDINFNAVGDISVSGPANTDEDIFMNAGGNLTTANLNSGAILDINAQTLTVGNLTSGGSILADATTGDATFGIVDAADTIAIVATGTPTLADAISGGDTSITGASLTFNSGTIGGDLTLNATSGDVDGNGTVTVAGGINLDATGNVGFGSLNAQGGAFAVDAGGDINFAAATSSNNINMTAVGSINGGDLTATNALNLNGGNIAIADASASAINFVSSSNILFNSITSPNAISLDAANGLIGANAGGGDIDSGGDVTLTAQRFAVNDVTSAGSVVATATAGNAAFGIVDAANNITINATGTPTLTNAISGGNIGITGASVTLNNGNVGGDLTLNATSGDVDGNGTVTVAGGIDLDATGNVGFGSLNAQGGAFAVDAGGDINFAAATSSNNIDMSAIGSINGGDLDAANALNLNGNNIAIGDAQADSLNFTSATNILFDMITSPNGVTLTAANGLIGKNTGSGNLNSGDDISLTSQSIDVGSVVSGGNILANITLSDAALGALDAVGSVTINGSVAVMVDTVTSGTSTTLTGTNVALNNGTIGSNLTLNAFAGDIDGNGAITVGGAIDLDATGDVGFGFLSASGGAFDVDAGGDITFTGATGTNDINMTAVGTISGGDLAATNALNLDGSNIAVGAASAASINFTSATDIIFDALLSPNSISLIASNGAIAMNTGNGDIDSDGDINLTAQTINVGDLTALGSVTADATAGDASFGTVDAATDITISAIGTPTLINAISGANTSIIGASVALDAGIVGGDLTLNAIAGDVDGTGSITVGGSIDLDATGDVSFGSLDAQGGTFTVDADGNINFIDATSSSDIAMNAGGGISGNSATSDGTGSFNAIAGLTLDNADITESATFVGDSVQLGDVSGGSIAANGGIVSVQNAAGDDITIGGDEVFVDLANGANIALTSARNGSVEANNLNATGTIDIDAGTGGFTGDTLVSDGALTLVANGAIGFDSANAGANVEITGQGNSDIAANSITSATNTILSTAGSLAVGDVTASQTGQGSVQVTSDQGIALDTVTGNEVDLTAINGNVILSTDANVTGDLQAFGQDIFLRSTRDLNVRGEATNGNVDILTSGNLNVRGASATGDITLSSTNGSNSVSDTFTRTSSTGIPPISAGGATSLSVISMGGNISVTAATDAIISSTLNAAGNLSVTAGNLVNVLATASGVNVDVTGADINIASTGRLGRSDQTQNLIITSDGTNQLILGGAGTAGAFSLDANEFAQIHSGGNLTISALSTATPGVDLLIQDLGAVVGNGAGTPTDGNIGTVGTLFLKSGNDFRVDGALTLSNASGANLLAIAAGNDVRLNAQGGNLRSEDASGNIAGRISLTAQSIVAATDSAAADIAGVTVADADTRLSNNDGITLDDGLFQANSLIFNVSNGLFIQNTAAGTDFDDRRGLRVDSLTINGPSTGNIGIVANGVVGGNTGISAIAPTIISGAFVQDSTINGCVIANPASCAPPPPTPAPAPAQEPDPVITDPVQDVIQEEVDSIDTITPLNAVDTNIIQIKNFENASESALIDEPVTGAGNDDLWIEDTQCEDGGGAGCKVNEDVKEPELEPAE